MGALTDEDLSAATMSGQMGSAPQGPQISAEDFLRGQEQGIYTTGKKQPFKVDPSKEGFGALYDENTGKFRSGGFIRDESTGQVTTFASPERQQPKGSRLLGYDRSSGRVADLGMTQETMESPSSQPDVTRPQLELVGVGKGFYSKDGKYLLVDGGRTKVLLGYNQRATEQGQDRQRDIRKDEADIAYRESMNKKLQAEMNAPYVEDTRQKPAPAGYRWTQDGARLEPIPGGPAAEGKALTDAQSKALLFGNRMAAAEQIFGELAKDGVNVSVPGSRAPLIGGMVNALQPESRQRLDQAKRDFINAVLRRESGAVITDAEFANAEQQYFPQIGESAAVIEQKRKARELAQRSIEIEVPETQRGKGREPAQGGLPPKSQLQRGQIYNTPRGRAVWTGDRFEAV
jgi:hypothetical protein